jgi:dTDP-4-amino-4,6-dideoxygalactose transaminase
MSSTINWINNKTIDFNTVQELLQLSLDTNQFTNNGPVLKKLENYIAETLQISKDKTVVCVANGTVALYAAVAAIELENNKPLQFATQSFTFPSSAQSYLKNTIIVDIDNDGGLDLSLIPPETVDGIIVTNVFGHLVDINKYTEWCKKWNKYLIFDNAATAFSFYNNNSCLNYGTASTISLHHTKPLGFGEGGAVIIDKKYELFLRRILNFGIDNLSPNPKWHCFGSNYKMSDIAATYCLQYLQNNFSKIISSHIFYYDFFWDLVEKNNIPIQKYPNFSDSTPFVSCIIFFSNKSSEIIKKALDAKIVSRKYYNPLQFLPISNQFYQNIVCLPCHLDLTKADIFQYIQIIKNCHLENTE